MWADLGDIFMFQVREQFPAEFLCPFEQSFDVKIRNPLGAQFRDKPAQTTHGFLDGDALSHRRLPAHIAVFPYLAEELVQSQSLTHNLGLLLHVLHEFILLLRRDRFWRLWRPSTRSLLYGSFTCRSRSYITRIQHFLQFRLLGAS